MASSKLAPMPSPVDVMTALYNFDARDSEELTIKEGQLLFLEDNGKVDEWARVRLSLDQNARSGLVPWSYISSKKADFQATALYRFPRQKHSEIEVREGQLVEVYGPVGTYILVKLATGEGPMRVGLIPQNYVHEVANDKEILGPVALKDLPASYCAVCEAPCQYFVRYECTECRLPNGSQYFICQNCADDRQACWAHQFVKGQQHLFRRHLPPNSRWICSNCNGSIDKERSFFCVSCPKPSSVGFELCIRCFNNSQVPRHQHPMIVVSPEGVLTQGHLTALVAQAPSYTGYTCDGCLRRIPRYVLNCKRCPAPGYDLCPDCTELDRAVYLHDRWTGGMPHEFEILDMQLAR